MPDYPILNAIPPFKCDKGKLQVITNHSLTVCMHKLRLISIYMYIGLITLRAQNHEQMNIVIKIANIVSVALYNITNVSVGKFPHIPFAEFICNCESLKHMICYQFSLEVKA